MVVNLVLIILVYIIYSVILCWVFKDVEHALNPSKHLPLVMDISVNIIKRQIHWDKDTLTELPICWHRVNENHVKKYQRKQEQLLSNIEEYEVLQCDNVNCDSAEHRNQIDQLCAQLVECCVLADDVLPSVRKQKRNWPHWHEDVKPYKDNCIWWYNLQVTSDKTSECIIFKQYERI